MGTTANLDIGIIGLGVMGVNLASNLADRGLAVGVHSRTETTLNNALKTDERLKGHTTLADLIADLKSPKTILIMVPSGKAVESQIEALIPLLSKGDIIIDAGNSYFMDTNRRTAWLTENGLHFVGLGVSGGEEGARHGPAMMAGCSEEAWNRIGPLLSPAAARAGKDNRDYCIDRVGPEGAGHFVKMIHNGIEYAEMQALAEAYDVLKRAGVAPSAMADIFDRWNQGPLASYLVDISVPILRAIDSDTSKPLVDIIVDAAGQKGTGTWTGQTGLELGVPIPTLLAATAARGLSALKQERVKASQILSVPSLPLHKVEELVNDLEKAIFAIRIINYAQGMALMQAAEKAWSWKIPLDRVARLWRGGCIIRARILDHISDMLSENPDYPNLLVVPAWRKDIDEGIAALRKLLGQMITAGISAPVFSSALAYHDGYGSAVLPANFIQAQRDFFGAHTYLRTDKEGSFHFNWGHS